MFDTPFKTDSCILLPLLHTQNARTLYALHISQDKCTVVALTGGEKIHYRSIHFVVTLVVKAQPVEKRTIGLYCFVSSECIAFDRVTIQRLSGNKNNNNSFKITKITVLFTEY